MATTSKMGIPYPASSDLVTDGATDMQSLAEEVDLRTGLVKIIPSGATNGTVSANGDVTIGSAVSSVTVADAFSADYDNYLITLNGGAGSTTIRLDLQLGATTSNYHYQLNAGAYSGSAVLVGSTTGAAFLYMGNATTDSIHGYVVVSSPFLTENTRVFSNVSSPTNAGTCSGVLFNTTSYTSFKIICNTGTLTAGTIRVYGYNQ